MEKEKEFNFVNLPAECNDPSISQDDFKFVQKDERIFDQKFETKPTTFFKDCLRRFVKNKSSVVATFILGFLILCSIVVPIAFKTSEVHDTKNSHPELYYLEPKLFKSGTGFWDGTKKMVDIPVDTNQPKEEWGPDYTRYNKNAVSDLVIGEEKYTTSPNEYCNGGFIQFGYYGERIPEDVDYIYYATNSDYLDVSEVNFAVVDFDIKVTGFVTYDEERLKNSEEKTNTYPENYVSAESALYFVFEKGIDEHAFPLTEYKKVHDIGGVDASVSVKPLLEAYIEKYNAEVEEEEQKITDLIVNEPRFEIRVKKEEGVKYGCTLIQSVTIDCDSPTAIIERQFEKYSFKDGNAVFIRPSVYGSITGDSDEEKAKKEAYSGIWTNFSSSKYSKDIDYLVRFVPCSFTYDTYEAALGKTTDKLAWNSEIYPLMQTGVIKVSGQQYRYKDDYGVWHVREETFSCEIVNADDCPFVEPFKASDIICDNNGLPKYVNCTVLKYKTNPYNLDKMPIFLMGTDKTGRDMFIYVFEGLRTSLLLGLATSAVCFLFGLFWGSICGYFGGTVDLVMERLTDILSGIPWIVVMTLTIIHLGSNFFTFALALCLTGWIGTAGTTRTQFYRFRGREYVLASRTLGASHARLITKHILPNAMGTIITSAVLMVPSVIFSEATISYLGLGFKNLASLGVILSDNQVELTNHPYLLIFPAVIIALLMISFNLFGNGLRDAVNPSLKGEGE